MITILAEKPSVARDIAAIVGANNKTDGYLYGNGYSVTWAFGHLVQLALPENYGVVGFHRENLPIIPDNFKLVVRQIRDNKTFKDDVGAVKQLKVVSKLFNECDNIIVATDAGREGELIFRYIYNYLNCRKPFQRLWISSLTDSAIKEGLDNLKDGVEYDKLYEAAKARSEADWLVGINASQALTISASNGGIYSLGRVQTPTLKMICNRYKENKSFVSETNYTIDIELDNGLVAKSKKMYYDKTWAIQALDNIENAKVVDIYTREVVENPPLLYDITTLQKDANKSYGYSAKETLDIAQALYEKKIITYPRTGSRYITNDVLDILMCVLISLSNDKQWASAVSELLNYSDGPNLQSVNSTKVTDHHALIPTEIKPSSLPLIEQNIYELIIVRSIEALMPICVKTVTNIVLESNEEIYTANLTQIVQSGWRKVKEEKYEDKLLEILPNLSVNDICVVKDKNLHQNKTKPKPLHTDSSLLAAMESASKDIDNKQERIAIKDLGLGTPATRAAIIEALLSRGYIIRDKRSLIPTEKGLAVYDIVKDMQIANVQLTGEWENGLCSIEDGTLDSETFKKVSQEYTRRITMELLSKELLQSNMPLHYCCPKCGKESVRILDKVAKCFEPNCNFILFRDIACKKLSNNQLEELINKGKVNTIKGFKSKAGNLFNAALVLDESYKVKFQFNKLSNSKE